MRAYTFKFIYRNGNTLLSLFCTYFFTINLPCFFSHCRLVHHMDVLFVSTLLGISWKSSVSVPSNNAVPQTPSCPCLQGRAVPILHWCHSISFAQHPPSKRHGLCPSAQNTSFLPVSGLPDLILKKAIRATWMIIWITDKSLTFALRKGDDCQLSWTQLLQFRREQQNLKKQNQAE